MSANVWSPDDWQNAVNLWLATRYPLGDFQKVPDRHGGDCGIEGFSTDGNVYQAHAPEALTTTKELYEKQRDKITTDVGKFCANGVDLVKMFAGMRVRRWLLVVPYYDSKMLVQHAGTKTKEVVAKALPYVADDFRVGILDESDFAVEQAKLLTAGMGKLQLDTPEPSVDAIATWTKSNAVFLATARGKLVNVLENSTKREQLVHELTRLYVRGETTLQTLDNDFPAIAGSARRLKAQREVTLEAESLVHDGAATARLQSVIATFSASLFEQIPAISPEVAEQLAWQAAADWIFRCPMNF